jgi:hypothetical protein
VGAGGSHEAAYDLKAGVPAGVYHVVLDGIVIQPVDVRFALIWRRGNTDTSLATWQVHFDPLSAGDFDAQALELDEPAAAIDFHAGDQLVFRYSGANAPTDAAYIPNGDGALKHGRIPNLTLPP